MECITVYRVIENQYTTPQLPECKASKSKNGRIFHRQHLLVSRNSGDNLFLTQNTNSIIAITKCYL